MKKLITALLAVLLLLPMAAACGNTDVPASTTENAVATTSPAEGTTEGEFVGDDLPDGLNFNDTVTIYMWNDYTMLEFYVEETSGNNIESAIFQRNANTESRLGIKLAYDSEKGASGSESMYIKKAEADVSSGDHLYDIYASYSRNAPSLSLKGYCADLLSTEYFNIDKPWWPKALTDECKINNKLFFASGDISTNLLWMMIATFYNRSMYAGYASDDRYSKTPEQYVKSNEWTMDRLFAMTKEYYTDTDGDGTKSAGDTFGMALYETNIDAYQTAAGIISIEKNGEGQLQVSSSFNGNRAADVCQLVGEYIASPGVWHKNSTAIRDIFFEERATFIMDRCFIVAGKDNSSNKDKIEFAFGIVPNPKYSADQENFGTNMGHPFTMYAIASSSARIPAASATLECLASESYRLVTPEVFESTMKMRYADGAEVAEMYDIIRDNVSFDIGRLYAASFTNYTTNAFRNSALSSPSGYLTNLSRYIKAINKGISTVSAAYEN